MAKVILALGSNLGDPHRQMKEAATFLTEITPQSPVLSSIYRTEPVGPSENDFLNAVAMIETAMEPHELLTRIKEQERKQGRPSRYPKWTARTLDIDIIAYDDLVIEADNLIIPHPEYTDRLFVLMPLKEVRPDWSDPATGRHVDTMIEEAPGIRIQKTNLTW
ncbi:2-amino-4-hydroxy-6-hydroxymethyldihydropteridine diphosphokinase [Balneola sp. MJW-20]|uniref:2-amino-4-hydroxy-6- hydroxymethyldihydropteridine diphosphokinase n=1 Tax=Gracilimonas aurantiaca TaxID=3234185 RepID=UPI0034655C91